MRVLLVEDDPGDAFLVRELFDEAGAPVTVQAATDLSSALEQLDGIDCVLLDLGLPDATGLDGLRRLLAHSGTRVAVCVLTGLADEHLGMAAVAEGAQDYLVKGRVDGAALTRSVRFAVERRRADENARALAESRLREGEFARLERGLLPKPLVNTTQVGLTTCYRPGRRRALLGGDFYDAVQTGPDQLRLLVGDVCGHGPQEAALGVTLRVAWRALTLAGVPEAELLRTLERVLVTERRTEETFATVATVSVDLSAGRATVYKCGHPPPLLVTGTRVEPVTGQQGIMLGISTGAVWHPVEVPLPERGWSILTYTDGLIEGRRDGGRTGAGRLGLSGLCDLVGRHYQAGRKPGELPDALVRAAEAHNGGPLPDDVAMLLLSWGRP